MKNDCKLPASGAAGPRHDPYRLHRLALLPLLPGDQAEALRAVREAVRAEEEQEFLLCIMQNGLGPLWHDLMRAAAGPAPFSPAFTRELRNIASYCAARYLYQKNALEKIDALFAAAAVPYAAFKGAHTRELLYADPSRRSACDLDILVAGADTARAISVLVEAGWAFKPEPGNISHEATLEDGRVAIDLHWNILRPGRTRTDMTGELLRTRQRFAGYWGLGSEATLLVMLVHPVFAKYATAPQAALLHLLDLALWNRTMRTDLDNVFAYLDQAGVKTAAWITATRLEMLTGASLPSPFIQRISPGPIRSRYLRAWLRGNLPTRLLTRPLLIQACFTLPAHDTPADAVRAVRQLMREKKEAPRKTEELLASLPQTV